MGHDVAVRSSTSRGRAHERQNDAESTATAAQKHETFGDKRDAAPSKGRVQAKTTGCERRDALVAKRSRLH